MDEEKYRKLERYQECLQRQTYLQEEMERLRSEAELPGMPLNGMPRGGGVDAERIPRKTEKILEMQEKYDEMTTECWNLYWEISEAIGELKEENVREVMRRRYLMGENMQEIADAMSVVQRRVYQLHKKGMREISI